MTENSFPEPGRRLATDAQLQQELLLILETPQRRQLWLFFLDDEHRILDPIVPMDDHPALPDEPCPGLGSDTLPFSEALLMRVGLIAESAGASSFAVVWERLGTERFVTADRLWARAFGDAAGRAGIPLRAQFLLHDHGIRPMTPDDYA